MEAAAQTTQRSQAGKRFIRVNPLDYKPRDSTSCARPRVLLGFLLLTCLRAGAAAESPDRSSSIVPVSGEAGGFGQTQAARGVLDESGSAARRAMVMTGWRTVVNRGQNSHRLPTGALSIETNHRESDVGSSSPILVCDRDDGPPAMSSLLAKIALGRAVDVQQALARRPPPSVKHEILPVLHLMMRRWGAVLAPRHFVRESRCRCRD